MPFDKGPFRDSGLMTDLYQLTMAYGYWKTGRSHWEATFHLHFRRAPFGGTYALAAGLEPACQFLSKMHFSDNDLEYLDRLRGADGHPLFEEAFLTFLGDLRFDCHVDAVPEGTPVFANEPLVRVSGPMITAQLVETALLNIVNFQTLIATKAARVCQAAGERTVLEFGLRRAQGPDGGFSASRAAHLGGCDATSNVLAGQRFGIPVRGTHAHSWVMVDEDELASFEAIAKVMPGSCILLVDTYETISGVRRAIHVAQQMEQRGQQLFGIRLDSGDLAQLSIQARRMLDEAGFPHVKIVASSDLDEYRIEAMQQQGAQIDIYGVGTRLVTAYDQPALAGVYKLSAVRPPDEPWEHRVKLSDDPFKSSTPGLQQVRRFTRDGRILGDILYDESQPLPEEWVCIDPAHPTHHGRAPHGAEEEDLLVPIFRHGERVSREVPLKEIRQRATTLLGRLSPEVRRLKNPEGFHIWIEQGLFELRQGLIEQARQKLDTDTDSTPS
jgi:nicotinate phosphoribosyltransferase